MAGGVIPQRGSPSRSENVQGAGGSTSVRISLNGQETAGNPASSWKAVLASAGAFGADLDGKKAAPNSTSVPNTPALAPLSPQPQPFAASRSNPSTAQSTTPSLDLANIISPAISKRPGSGSMLQVQKARTTSDPHDTSHGAHAARAGKNVNTESVGKPAANAVLEPVATALPAMASAPVMAKPAMVPAQDQLASSSRAELRSGGASSSATPRPTVPESKTSQNIVNDWLGIKTADGMRNEPGQPMPLSTPAQPIDAYAQPFSANDIHSSSSLKSAALFATQEATSSTLAKTHQESGSPIAEAVPGAPSGGTPIKDGLKGQFASAVPVSAETRGASAVGWAAKQAAPSAGRTSALPEVANDVAHSASQASISLQQQSAFSPIGDAARIQSAPGAIGKSGSASASPPNTAASSAHEILVSLDGASRETAPTWIHAGARAAEAGYQDPALGWVGVRAQLDINGVHASLVPNSADAAQALGGHLAGLNAYLTEHHTLVETLSMSAPESRSNGQGFEQGIGQSAGEGGGMGEHSGQPTDPNRDRASTATTTQPIIAAASENSAAGTPPGGVYVSVMA